MTESLLRDKSLGPAASSVLWLWWVQYLRVRGPFNPVKVAPACAADQNSLLSPHWEFSWVYFGLCTKFLFVFPQTVFLSSEKNSR